ncbi:MAG: zinc ribbon domain-containing protein [Lachnospiraceae bacterium]|nr:zinc ribbon domain-containing protein [Lachnospiraceae bacterium]
MSKKCCGIIYNENEKFCTRCGKPLIDTPEEETPLVLDMSEVDKIAASVRGEMEKEQEAKEETVSEETFKEQTNQEESQEEQTVAVEETASQVETTNSGEEEVQLPSDDSEEDDGEDDDDDDDDGKASVGLKLFGTLMIIIMLASIAAVGLGIYFVKLNPYYKNHNINAPVVYEGVATDTDVNNVELTPLLTPVSIEVQTSTDAVEETATVTDAEDTEETEDESDSSEENSESEE